MSAPACSDCARGASCRRTADDIRATADKAQHQTRKQFAISLSALATRLEAAGNPAMAKRVDGVAVGQAFGTATATCVRHLLTLADEA